jgi:esterase/lipase superfamily enzyme
MDQALVDRINTTLSQSDQPDIFIFVHGYNTGFDEAVFQSAELWYFLGQPGVAISYSWPSRDSVWWYSLDRESAVYSSGHLHDLVNALATQTNAHRIHLISHSTGALLVGNTLRELILERTGQSFRSMRQQLRIGHVVLAAPDIDYDIARQRMIGQGINLLPERLTIYISSHDVALRIATESIYGLVRLGMVNPENLDQSELQWLAQQPRVDVIDVSNRRGADVLEHRHHTLNPYVSSDLILLLRYGLSTPPERGLEQSQVRPMWLFPHGYPQHSHFEQPLLPPARQPAK